MSLEKHSLEITQFVAGLKYPQIPKQVVNKVKLHTIDWIGCALAGAADWLGKNTLRLASRFGEISDGCSVVTTDLKLYPSDAAFVNGILGHIVELDDADKPGMAHISVPIIPAALAVCEYSRKSGTDFLEAVVAGFEVMIRMCRSVAPDHYRFWHPTGTGGTIGAAVASCKGLGLPESEILSAIGIACTQASGLVAVFGSPAKPVNAGRAAQSGVLSAVLASEGFSAPTNALESARGLLRATSPNVFLDTLSSNLGSDFLALEVGFKTYASCGHTHSPLSALFEILEDGYIDLSEISQVDIWTYGVAAELVSALKTSSAEEAKFSLPFCIAVALETNRVSLSEFETEVLQNQEVLSLAKKVHVHEDHAANREFPEKRLARVRITFRDGSKVEKQVEQTRMYPSEQELKSKFESLASRATTKENMSRIWNRVSKLEQVDDMRDVAKLLRLR
jgi:2-methylcitrate dehydratase PrpD